MVMLLPSIPVFDVRIPEMFSSWLPETILQFSSPFEGDDDISPMVLLMFLIVAFTFNAVISPAVMASATYLMLISWFG
jgi:hypothetical protein